MFYSMSAFFVVKFLIITFTFVINKNKSYDKFLQHNYSFRKIIEEV